MVEPKPEQSKRIITWEQYWAGIVNLKQQLDTVDWINADTLFYGIPRGGVIANTLLLYCLNKHTLLLDTSVQDVCRLNEVDAFISNFVLVDDLVDSGQTMFNLIKDIQDKFFRHKNYKIRTVVLFKRYSSMIEPTIFYQQINNDDWLIFPYEPQQ